MENNIPDLIPYRKGDKWGFCTPDKAGIQIIPCEYDLTNICSEDLVMVISKDRYGFIDATGKQVTSCIYYDAEISKFGWINVALTRHWDIIDKNGTQYWED